MPVSISCPKCKTKYSLPDELQGKPVKCKSCGVTFRTKSGSKARVAAGAKAKKDSPHVVSQQDINKFGIAGQLQRPPEIFAATSNQSPQSVALGNFALEDPGFADVEDVQPENEAKGNGRSGKRKPPRPVVDLAPYSTARWGMRFLYFSCGYLLAVIGLMFVVGIIASLTGDWTPPPRSRKGDGTTALVGIAIAVVFIVLILIKISFPIAFIMSFVGQILCITTPNKNEKLAAGLAIGTLLAAVVLAIVSVFMTEALSVMTRGAEGKTADAADAVIGIMGIGFAIGVWLLFLSSMYFFISFYRHMGRNIRSKQLVTSAKHALVTCATTIVVSVVSGVTIIVLVFLAPDTVAFETVARISTIGFRVNFGLGLATAGTIMVMISTGIKRTAVE